MKSMGILFFVVGVVLLYFGLTGQNIKSLIGGEVKQDG